MTRYQTVAPCGASLVRRDCWRESSSGRGHGGRAQPPALSVLLTRLVLGSGGAVSLAIAAHLLGNLLGELLPDDPSVAALEAAVMRGGAVVVVVLLRREDRLHRIDRRDEG